MYSRPRDCALDSVEPFSYIFWKSGQKWQGEESKIKGKEEEENKREGLVRHGERWLLSGVKDGRSKGPYI